MLASRRFRYGALLRVRRRREEQRALALAQTFREIIVTEQRLDSLRAERRRMLEEAGRRARASFSAAEIRDYYQYERHLARLDDAAHSRLEELRAIEAERRDELAQAMRERRIVEVLNERRLRALLAAELKGEQRMADETAGNAAARSRKKR